jgi:hypothetical protein
LGQPAGISSSPHWKLGLALVCYQEENKAIAQVKDRSRKEETEEENERKKKKE